MDIIFTRIFWIYYKKFTWIIYLIIILFVIIILLWSFLIIDSVRFNNWNISRTRCPDWYENIYMWWDSPNKCLSWNLIEKEEYYIWE